MQPYGGFSFSPSLLLQVELGRWMGPELIRANLYDKLRDAQKDDVEKLLQEAPAGRPKPERLTRKEAEKAAAAAVVATGPAAEGGAVAVEGAAVAAAADEEPEQVSSGRMVVVAGLSLPSRS